MDAPRGTAGTLRCCGLAIAIGTVLVVSAVPTLHAKIDTQSRACAYLRSRSSLSPVPVDRIQRVAREREIRACLAEIRNENQTAWLILRARDPHIFRPASASELQVDGVTEADIVTALDAAARRSQGSLERPLVPILFMLLMMGVVLTLYFLPSFVAASRGHENRTAIFALNLLLGWTFLGWVGALVWSLTRPRRTA
jgi:hypothetical protein